MSRLRHSKKYKPEFTSGEDTEASASEEFKKGGRVKKYARGGKIDMGEPDADDMPKRARMDRPGRKRGGRAGADMAPLSSAGGKKNPFC